jgi:hypothetical protein
MSEHADNPVGSVTRRRMLGRIGATSALVWSAPILTSISSPAFAQASPRCEAHNLFCGDDGPDCAERGCQPEGCPVGRCTVLIDGDCLCWQVIACRTAEPPICQTDSDCPFNARCAPITDCPGNPCVGQRACYTPCFVSPAPQRQPTRQGDVITAYAH